jgi:hypothetical protein
MGSLLGKQILDKVIISSKSLFSAFLSISLGLRDARVFISFLLI